jgi:UDP-glucuronate 4-epimerase
MKILVTGSAGFIGSALCLRLLELGNEVIGLDNHNDYYSPLLKEARLSRQQKYKNYKHIRTDLCNQNSISKIFKDHKPQKVINMAAQAGVRYSLKNPMTYINSNIVGFLNILEGCRYNGVEHLVYASSSSVYGANTSMPYSVNHNVDHPLSVYAATKKSNELMAHSYSHLYKLPTTALRFFTVYGPWDRPDMALQKFAKAIINGETIKLFNNGNHQRDFTFIDDIVEGVLRVLNDPAKPKPNWSSDSPDPGSSNAPWKIYNIGNNQPVKLTKYIEVLENSLGKKAKKEFLPIQPGDVPNTWANIDDFVKKFDYNPKNSIEEGVVKFANWFKTYYKI